MIQPFSDNDLKVRFYHHTPPLTPVIDYGIKNSLLLINDLFGVPALSKKEILEISENNIIILDITHSIFDSSRLRISADNIYVIASLRKVFPICDGGIIYSSDPSFHPRLSDPTGWETMLEAMFLKRYYLNTQTPSSLETVKQGFRQMYDRYSEKKGLPIRHMEKIPDISIVSLQSLNYSDIRKKRQTNLERFYANISGHYFLYPLKSITSPFIAPIIFENNRKRNHKRMELIRRNVFPPVHWNLPSEIPLTFAHEYEISRRILSVPIDQRYYPSLYERFFDVFE
jgi:hypothetical protein